MNDPGSRDLVGAAHYAYDEAGFDDRPTLAECDAGMREDRKRADTEREAYARSPEAAAARLAALADGADF